MRSALSDLSWLTSRRERSGLRQIVRRVIRDHEAGLLADLQGLAAARATLTSVLWWDRGGQAASAELVIAGRRVRAGCLHRGTVSALAVGVGGAAAIPLLTAGRYGPYWVLTFGLAHEPLPVLVDRLVILPDWPGRSAGRALGPPGRASGTRGSHPPGLPHLEPVIGSITGDARVVARHARTRRTSAVRQTEHGALRSYVRP